MLSHSSPSSSDTRPLPISESSEDFSLMLSIIAGDPTTAITQCLSWAQAERLYRMMQKYQLDRHQPWFTKMCCAWVAEDPLKALILACTHATFDEELALAAIANGLATKTSEDLFHASYFLRNKFEQSPSFRNAFLLLPSNTTIRLHFELGLGIVGVQPDVCAAFRR
ncbi:hypothetical protein NCC49_000511 [Naganishia albida]|nr:hypothetical protein NCC49_000511 [Naganishia albida]